MSEGNRNLMAIFSKFFKEAFQVVNIISRYGGFDIYGKTGLFFRESENFLVS